ncbi:PfkB family carbohydrate kinase [Quadrisphaera sp. KR29]|uniref:PfkB family carbohydrate kinase n=1 Tax=Quadrisphaera sp. KR29 TaxID=3461391 RepID=UPI004043D5E6
MSGLVVLLAAPALDVTHLVSGVAPGAVHRPQEVLRLAGGKGLNLARAAAALGTPVRVVAPLGGPTGVRVAEAARAEGLDLVAVPVAGETRTCFTAATGDGAPTDFYEPAAPLAAPEAAALLAALRDAPLRGWTVVSGSLPAGLDPAAVAAVLRGRRAAGDAVAVDTHGAALAVLVQDGPDLVKVNRAEASALLGEEHLDLAAATAALVRRTGGAVVVTDGEAGAVGADPSAVVRVPPHPCRGGYPTGSGDAHLAGLLTALSRGQDLRSALLAAAAAGAANAAVPGAGRLAQHVLTA